MKIEHDSRLPDVLVAYTQRPSLFGAIGLMLFGCAATIAGLHTLITEPAPYRNYGFVILVLGIPSLLIGVRASIRRRRFTFDRAARTVTIDRVGSLFRRRRIVPLSSFATVVLVRYCFLNRAVRHARLYWYRVQLRTTSDDVFELASKLKEHHATEDAGKLAGFLGLPMEHRDGRAEGVVVGR